MNINPVLFWGEMVFKSQGKAEDKAQGKLAKVKGSRGANVRPKSRISRWGVDAPMLSATPVPRCVMDITMGRDHLQNKQRRQQNAGQRRGCTRSYLRNPAGAKGDGRGNLQRQLGNGKCCWRRKGKAAAGRGR